MDRITVVMSQREYKKYLAYREADKIVRRVRCGLAEIQEAREGKRKLKSAYDIDWAYETDFRFYAPEAFAPLLLHATMYWRSPSILRSCGRAPCWAE